jgi:hypothetical protein
VPDTCAGGICLDLSDQTERFCSAFCTLGAPGCGFDGAEESAGAACLLPQIPGESSGDRGVCFELCDEDADCREAGSVCVPRPVAGRAGVCLRPTLPLGPGTPPPVTGQPSAGAGGSAGGTEGSGGSGNFPGGDDSPPIAVDAGATCTSDADCGALLCDLQSGRCVAPAGCASDADCAGQTCDVSSGSCVPPSPACTSDAACPGQVCDADLGLCVAPNVCALDADCVGEVCDPTAGLCIEKPAIPIGGVCAADADCAGAFCFDTGTVSFCSGGCLLGTANGCEAYGTDAFCLLPVPNQDPLGVCLELCNMPADCAQSGFDCLDIGGTLNGYTGACLPSTPPG